MFRLLTVLVLLLTITGCGGSTRGTGGNGAAFTLSGRLTNEANEPLAGVTVIVAETGDSGTTDNFGNFSISTEKMDSFTLIIESNNTSPDAGGSDAMSDTNFIINDIPTEASEVNTEIVIDSESGAITDSCELDCDWGEVPIDEVRPTVCFCKGQK